MALTKAGGTWVVGDRFFDRTADLVALSERCQEGAHTLLTAQRRIGKTSLVRELLRILEESGQFDTVFADLEGGSTPADAIAEIWNQARQTSGFWHRIHHRLRQLGTRVEALEAADIRVRLRADVNAGNWRARGESILGALARGDKPIVLALDELPIIVNRMLRGSGGQITPEGTQAAGEFLGWLRKMGQQHQGRVTFILTGSAGLEPVLRQAGLSAHANIFLPYELKPWDEDTASHCLTELAQAYQIVIPLAVCQEMCQRLRCCIPHHVHQFFAYVLDHLRRSGTTETTFEDIAHVYSDTMLGVRGQTDLDHYETRLKVILDHEAYTCALALLTEAAVGDGALDDRTIALYADGASDVGGSTETVATVLYALEHDGYLTRSGEGYRFTSGLIEDWWRARHGQFFRPIANGRS